VAYIVQQEHHAPHDDEPEYLPELHRRRVEVPEALATLTRDCAQSKPKFRNDAAQGQRSKHAFGGGRARRTPRCTSRSSLQTRASAATRDGRMQHAISQRRCIAMLVNKRTARAMRLHPRTRIGLPRDILIGAMPQSDTPLAPYSHSHNQSRTASIRDDPTHHKHPSIV
jgi:hypothetical protein